MYILYVSEVLTGISERIQISQFADDIGLYIETDNVEEDILTLENAIKKIKQNLFELGLDISPEKINFVHFNKTLSNFAYADGNLVIFLQ